MGIQKRNSKHKRSKSLAAPLRYPTRSEPSACEIGTRAGTLIDSIFESKYAFKIADVFEALEIIADATTLIESKMEKNPKSSRHPVRFPEIEKGLKDVAEDLSSDSQWKKTVRISMLENQKRVSALEIEESEEILSVDPPEQWRETIWRKIQKKIFPSAYREDLQYNALLWDRYMKYVQDGIILPMPPIPRRHIIFDTGPR